MILEPGYRYVRRNETVTQVVTADFNNTWYDAETSLKYRIRGDGRAIPGAESDWDLIRRLDPEAQPIYDGVTPGGDSLPPTMPADEYRAFALKQGGGVSTITGIKHDENKLPWHLLSVCAVEEMLRVLQYGAGKYTAHNWRGGFKWTRLIAAASRHLFAFMRGEDRDAETGCLHVAHLMCCAMFLTEHVLRKLGADDRFKETA